MTEIETVKLWEALMFQADAFGLILDTDQQRFWIRREGSLETLGSYPTLAQLQDGLKALIARNLQ